MLLVLRCKKLVKCLDPPSVITVKVNDQEVDKSTYTEDEDRDCLAFMSGYMTTEVQLKVVSCETSWETWERIQQVYENKNPANVGKIFEKYYGYRKDATDDMSAHISKVESMAVQLGMVGEKQSETSIMAKMLYSLPAEYDSLKSAWESVHPEHQTRRNLTARLLAHDVARSSEQGTKSKEVALLTNQGKMNKSAKKKQVKCYNCGKMGHFAKECRSSPQSGDQPSQQGAKSSNKGKGPSVALVMNVSEKCDKWVIDSGASRHTCCRRDWFRTFTQASEKLQVGNEDWVEATGKGSIHVICDLGNGKESEVIFKEVLYIPKMSFNLFSTIEAAKNGAKISMDNRGCRISYNGQTVGLGSFDDSIGVCTLKCKTEAGVLMLVSTRRTIDDWHRALGHVDPAVISEMANNHLVDGMEVVSKPASECAQCPVGKATHVSHTRPSSQVVSEVGDQVDVDLVGPLPDSLGGNRYLLIAIDKFSSYSWVCPIRSKDLVCKQLQYYIGQFEAISDKRIRTIQADNGSEFVNSKVEALLGVEHIYLKTSSPYTPQQNGLAERNNRYIIEATRTIMAESGLTGELWAEAAVTAAYLVNRVPRRGAKVTPYELFKGRRPFVGHLVPFGTPVQSLINDRRLGKLDPKTEPGYIVGYTDRSNTYRVYLPKDRRIKTTCDVIFRQHASPMGGQLSAEGLSQSAEVVVERATSAPQSVVGGATEKSPVDLFFETLDRHYENLAKEQHQVEEEPQPAADMSEIESPSFSTLTNFSQGQRASQGDSSLASLDSTTPFQGRSIPRSPTKSSKPTLLLSSKPSGASDESTPVPQSFEEATQGPNKGQWSQAIAGELAAHMRNKTWSVVKRPEQGVLLSTKWVFNLKLDGSGKIERYKARLVARGFEQRQGIDFDETYSPVARRESIRVLLAIAVTRGMKIERFDVSTAFLNGTLDDKVFIEPPEGVRVASDECCQLNKALYGLKQAPRVWSSLFDKTTLSLGFVGTTSDPCVYHNKQSNCYLSIYVDDGIIVGPSDDACIKLIAALNKNFDTRRITSDIFLGMQIAKVDGGYHLSQSRYVEDIGKSIRLENCTPCTMPLADTKILYTKDDDETVAGPYRAWIGTLNYVAHATRPDVLFATALLARFQEAPKKAHWAAAQHVIKYLLSTKTMGLSFTGPHKDIEIAAYADADWAGDEHERKSTSGVIITICGSPIIFSSRLQTNISQSSTEAEFVAACDAVKELAWLTGLLGELGVQYNRPTLYIDNMSTIKLIKNQDVKRRSRHIELRYFYVRQCYKENKVSIEHVTTTKQLADFLTKRLGAKQLAELLPSAGIIKREDQSLRSNSRGGVLAMAIAARKLVRSLSAHCGGVAHRDHGPPAAGHE